MNELDITDISINVLKRLSSMGYERDGHKSSGQLIFPEKSQNKDTPEDRISEQELRLLFIDEFKRTNKDLYYSIETPTVYKYKFGDTLENNKIDIHGRSASLDMCVFKIELNKYKRILNIEFKHKNSSEEKIGKDILKLIHETPNGAFIQLLDNTNRGTLCNEKKTGVFNKLYKSFLEYIGNWKNESKSIQLIILSLKQKVLLHRKIHKTDLQKLDNIFLIGNNSMNITTLENGDNGWNVISEFNY